MTTKITLLPGDAEFPSTNGPGPTLFQGTNFPVSGLAFDTTTQETCYFKFPAADYASGNPTLDIYWYADTASSGGIMFGASLAAITYDTDTQDVETKAFATENTNSDTHLGTTGQRLHRMTITITNLDSLTADDLVWLRLRRVPADATDTMTGDAIVVALVLTYT